MKIVECPRDAMQGIKDFIPTQIKADYINKLLKVGFDTIDFGSFVSPKWIPQLSDTTEVLSKLDIGPASSKLLAIIANLQGTSLACNHDEIRYLGFPFSISETFQIKNINATMKESLGRVEDIQIVLNLCQKFNKELIIYISMAFGNPYGDPWSEEIIYEWTEKLSEMGVKIIALSDTVGVSKPEDIKKIFSEIISKFPAIEFGAHFHTTSRTWEEKIKAAWESGCRRFDGALMGYGGCPMAASELVGNMPTENLVSFFKENGVDTGIDFDLFYESMLYAGTVFPGHH